MSLSHSYSVRIALALLPVLCTAQTAAWTAPSSGYVYDSVNRSVRPLTGFIGAAVSGPPVADGIDWVSIAPNRKSALADYNGSRLWIPDLAAPEQSQTLDHGPAARQALWAADSSQAVILDGDGQLIWLSISSSGPVRSASWNLERREEASFHLLAADSSAQQVLLTSRTGATWQIWLASPTSPPVRIPYSGHPVAAAFAPADGGVFIADTATHRIVRIQNLDTVPVLTPLVSLEAYVNHPSAMVLSSDGKRLFLADNTDKMIRVFDSHDGTLMAELPTDAPPGSLTSFSEDRFLLNSYDANQGQPMFFLDTHVPASLSFVPGGK